MEMRAAEATEMGQDLTPPLLPLAFSLYDSFLTSHCSACFSPLSSAPCCSPILCFSHTISASPPLLSSDIRAALSLLRSVEGSFPDRIRGLLTNRHFLMTSSISSAIRGSAVILQRARGGDFDQNDLVLEEAALCAVITNAVEVTDETGRALGIAVYDTSFSWINHSCFPNACYHFLISPPTSTPFPEESEKMRIVPHFMESGHYRQEGSACEGFEYRKGRSMGYGPRIVVRSIKRIEKGEDVTVSYIDILQPKARRQSDLWSKYQFFCFCRRCMTSPPVYADSVLERIISSEMEGSGVRSNDTFIKGKASESIIDFVEEAIDYYLSDGNPESCCEKIEYMLNHGLRVEHLEMEKGKPQPKFRLHPVHHVALNAYTTLASAYKVRSESAGYQLEAFDMSRISAAYSLLLAGVTHRLFLSESSFIASAANFWTGAGQCLLSFARSSAWNLLAEKERLPTWDHPSLRNFRCCTCSLLDIWEADLSLDQTRQIKFEEISNKFLECMANYTTQENWSFLVRSCQYLETLKDPIDFSWLEKPSDVSSFEIDSGSRVGDGGGRIRLDIYQMGIHSLLYGGHLSNICYGRNSHLVRQVHSLCTRSKLHHNQ